jgi:hypothetical protein
MPPVERVQALWVRLAGGEGSDERDDLGGGRARFGHGAAELSDWYDKEPGGSKIGIHLVTSFDGVHLGASPSASRLACERIGKIGVRSAYRGG